MTNSLNFQPIIDAAKQAFIEANAELGEIFQSEVPVRSGALKSSYKVTWVNSETANHEWTKEYASYVHEDIVLKNGQVRQGRHWTRNGLAQYQEIYDRKLRERLP